MHHPRALLRAVFPLFGFLVVLEGCEPPEELYLEGDPLPDAKLRIAAGSRDSLVDSAGRQIRKRPVHLEWEIDSLAFSRYPHRLEFDWLHQTDHGFRLDLATSRGQVDFLWGCQESSWGNPNNCSRVEYTEAGVFAVLPGSRFLRVGWARVMPR